MTAACRNRIGALALLGLAVAVGWPARTARAEDDATALGRRVKAAFVYKFAGYVEWPAAAFPRPETPVSIGVMGDDPLAAELSRLVAGRTSGGRPVTVTRLKAFDAVAGIHLLFIGRSESARLDPLIRTTHDHPILVVTESDGALNHGSMINFLLSEGRVRFEVSLAAVEHAGLSLSSRLLAVAHSVITEHP